MKFVPTVLLAVLLLFSPVPATGASAASAVPIPTAAVDDSDGGNFNAFYMACLARCDVAYAQGIASCAETCPDICLLKVILLGCLYEYQDTACWELCARGHATQLAACRRACLVNPHHLP